MPSINKTAAILAFLAPIAAAAAALYLFEGNRTQFMNRMAQQGGLAAYSYGIVDEDDIQQYVEYPPQYDSSILRALELTPEDVDGLDREMPDWLEQEFAQALFKRIIQNIAIIDALHAMNPNGPPPEVQNEARRYRESLMKRKLESELDHILPTVDQAEMLQYYVKNPRRFLQKDERLARHIMLVNDVQDARSLADSIWERLNQGESFHQLVNLSQSETAAVDGFLGWVEPGTMAAAFEEALWAMEIREVTGPVKVGDTIHFIQLIDLREEGMKSFDESREEIHRLLVEEKRLKHRSELLGLTESVSDGNDAAYQEALLKTAYKRGYDRDETIANQAEAYERYLAADEYFQSYVERHQHSSASALYEESPWSAESLAAQDVLDRIGFQMLVKLAVVDETE